MNATNRTPRRTKTKDTLGIEAKSVGTTETKPTKTARTPVRGNGPVSKAETASVIWYVNKAGNGIGTTPMCPRINK